MVVKRTSSTDPIRGLAPVGALDEVREFYENNRLPQALIPTVTSTASADEFITQFQVRNNTHMLLMAVISTTGSC